MSTRRNSVAGRRNFCTFCLHGRIRPPTRGWSRGPAARPVARSAAGRTPTSVTMAARPSGRNAVGVGSRRGGRRDAGQSRSVQLNAVQVALARIVRRRDEVEALLRLVHLPAVRSRRNSPGVTSCISPPARDTRYTCRQPSRSLIQVNDLPSASHRISSWMSTQASSRSSSSVETSPVDALAIITRLTFCRRFSCCSTISVALIHSIRAM